MTTEPLYTQVDMRGGGFESNINTEGWGYTSSCMILRLLSMELGYIRYDYDPEHENGKFHPLHHLDINYSSKGTYKLGMNNKIQINDFVDLLDVKKECRYIKE